VAAPELPLQQGHDTLYRLTATGEDAPTETRYFLSPYEARSWRNRLRATGYAAHVASVPSAAFSPLPDGDLDRLAAEEQAQADRTE
jgi:hypothetical protein